MRETREDRRARLRPSLSAEPIRRRAVMPARRIEEKIKSPELPPKPRSAADLVKLPKVRAMPPAALLKARAEADALRAVRVLIADEADALRKNLFAHASREGDAYRAKKAARRVALRIAGDLADLVESFGGADEEMISIEAGELRRLRAAILATRKPEGSGR